MKKRVHQLKLYSKRHLLNHHGVTLIETVAAIAIISLVLVSAFTIAINTRVQILAQERRLAAQQEITLVRSQVMARLSATAVANELGSPGEFVVLTNSETQDEIQVDGISQDCSEGSGSPFESLCAIFSGDYDYSEAMIVTLTLNALGATGVEEIQILVRTTYHGNREVEVEGSVFVPVSD